MADTWELILHHTYAGTPGVVVDASPGRRAHGTASDVPFGSWLPDGVESGSGVIDFRTGGVVRVPAGDWNPLRGLHAEVQVCGDADAGGPLITTDRFHLSVGSGFLTAYFRGEGAIPSDIVYTCPFRLDPAQWATVGVTHDGISTVELFVDGQRRHRTVAGNMTLSPIYGITIGNSHDESRAFGGLIDDVKIWRANPHRVDNEFTGRPMDPESIACWRRWTDALGAVAAEDPMCLERVRDLIQAAVDDVHTTGFTDSDQMRQRWFDASRDYRLAWAAGDMQAVTDTLVGLYRALVAAGLDPTTSNAFAALQGEPCLAALAEAAPALDCDPGFTGVIGGAIDGVRDLYESPNPA